MSSSINSTSCYYPDGVTNGAAQVPALVPCDPSAPVSACCAVGETCTGLGFCYSKLGHIYRGACTDKTWRSTVCPYYCQLPVNYYQTLFGCDSGNTFSCDKSCSDNFTVLNLGVIKQVNITGLVSEAVVSSSGVAVVTQTATSTSVSSNCPSSSSNNSAAIGAGVGVPLGVLLLAALGSTFWHRRKWMQDRGPSAAIVGQHSQDTSYPGYTKGGSAHNYGSPNPTEMGDERAKIEMSGDPRRGELP